MYENSIKDFGATQREREPFPPLISLYLDGMEWIIWKGIAYDKTA